MITKLILGLGFRGTLIAFVFFAVVLLVVKSRWRLEKAKEEEVRRKSLLAAEEERRAEIEANYEYWNFSESSRDELPIKETKLPITETRLRSKEGVGAMSTAFPLAVMMVCAFCSVPASLRCKKCKAVRYCSGKCQIAHWRQGHKDECFPPSINNKYSGQSPVASLQAEQVEQIDLINGNTEFERHAPSQLVQTPLEPRAASVLTSTSDILNKNKKLEEKTDNATGARSMGYSVDSSEPISSGVFSAVTRQAASAVDESILNDTALGHPQSSSISPNKPVIAVNNFDLDTSSISGSESTSTYSDVNSRPCFSHLVQNKSIPTVETIEGLSSDHQPNITSEYEFVDLTGGKDKNSVSTSSDSGSKIQNPSTLPATEESKSQSEHEKTKAFVISTTNSVESGILGSKAHASSAGQLSSHFEVDATAVTRTSRMNNESTNPRKSADNNGLIPNGVTTSKRIADHLTVPGSSLIDSSGTGPIKSMEDRCPMPNDVTTSMKRVVSQLIEPKTSRNYHSELMLFPYDQFIKLYNYNIIEVRPCGLTNRGNSCYANAVLQCLAFTRPLTAYFLEGLHSKKCKKRDWCLTCEFESLLASVKKGKSPLSPSGIISHLDGFGGNFSYGRQEDAHEFLRFVVDAMQSVCLKETGVKPGNQLAEETTLIQQTFGGHLQSKIKCSRCKGKSERCERMMDLTVEIHGDINTLEEALKRFTSDEILDGENKYKCARCKSYVRARKKLTILEAPNILVIALKRFQSGKFGKLNKSVQFPEYLDLAPYMSSTNDKSPVYRLYALVVHIDVLNSSQSGHYICYVKDTRGTWYNVDDIKVRPVELQKVLSEGAYMLFYARCSPRAPSIVRKAMANPSGMLKRSKSNFWGKSGPLLRHLSVPAPAINSFDFESADVFDDNIHPFVKGYSSDNSSLFSNSDAGSSSTDSTRDSTSTEEHWETLGSSSPFQNSENSDDFTCSPSALSQSSDKVSNEQNSNLYSIRNIFSDVGFSGRKVDTDAETFGYANFMDRGDYYPSTNHGSLSFLYSDDSKQYRNLTADRTVESDFISSNNVKSGVLYRRTSGRNTQPFY